MHRGEESWPAKWHGMRDWSGNVRYAGGGGTINGVSEWAPMDVWFLSARVGECESNMPIPSITRHVSCSEIVLKLLL